MRAQYLRIEKQVHGKKNKCLLNARWVECAYCQKMFFNTKEERDKYVKYQERKDKHLKRLVAKHIEEFKKEHNIIRLSNVIRQAQNRLSPVAT